MIESSTGNDEIQRQEVLAPGTGDKSDRAVRIAVKRL
jgi:hypothetical protein